MMHKQAPCYKLGIGRDCDDCEHCHLAVCVRCKCYEGSLTSECPGMPVSFDSQELIYKSDLNFTRDRGWHLDDDRQFMGRFVAFEQVNSNRKEGAT